MFPSTCARDAALSAGIRRDSATVERFEGLGGDSALAQANASGDAVGREVGAAWFQFGGLTQGELATGAG